MSSDWRNGDIVMPIQSKNAKKFKSDTIEKLSDLPRTGISTFKTNGKGLVASELIMPEQIIIEYVGVVKRFDDFKKDYTKNHERQSYGMVLQADFVIDASQAGNNGRLTNYSCVSNAYCDVIYTHDGAPKRVIIAKTRIPAGEEITYDYNTKVFKGYSAMRCSCKTKRCKMPANSDDETSDDENKKKPLPHLKRTCQICHRTFPRSSNLNRHIDHVHNRKKTKDYQCDIEGCGKVFSLKHHFEAHKKIHIPANERDRPFRCKVLGCKKSFFTKQHKDDNEAIHTIRQPLQCNILQKDKKCNKKFLALKNLKQHYKKHTRVYKPNGTFDTVLHDDKTPPTAPPPMKDASDNESESD